jgi:hydrogenase nickel incorporation protein HypB
MEIKLVKKVLEANEVIAFQNRRLFREKGIYVVNPMGSPGAGKTTLLERTLEHLKDKKRIGVIEGKPVCSVTTNFYTHFSST